MTRYAGVHRGWRHDRAGGSCACLHQLCGLISGEMWECLNVTAVALSRQCKAADRLGRHVYLQFVRARAALFFGLDGRQQALRPACLVGMAGFEPAASCSQTSSAQSPGVALRRPISRSPGMMLAGRRPASPDDCARWLPLWLPLLALVQERREQAPGCAGSPEQQGQTAGVPRLCSLSLGSGRLTLALLRALLGGWTDGGTATGAPADLSVGLLTPWTGSHQRGPRR